MIALLAAALLAQVSLPPLQRGDVLPPFALVDQDARPFSTGSLRGNVTILGFIYTSCKEARECPLETSKFARMERVLRAGERLRLLEVTIDPQRDTPAVLGAYARGYERRDDRWTFATGTPETLGDLRARFAIAVTPKRDGSFEHDDRLVILDAAGRLAATIDGDDWQPADVLARARAVGDGASAPFPALRLWLTSAIEACGGSRVAIPAFAVLGVLAASAAAFALMLRRAIRLPS